MITGAVRTAVTSDAPRRRGTPYLRRKSTLTHSPSPQSTPPAPGPGRSRPTGRGPLARLTVVLIAPLLTALGGLLFVPGGAMAQDTAHAPLSPAVSSTLLPAPGRAVADDTCTSSDPAVCRIREMTPQERAQAREIRMRYHELLDRMVEVADTMRAHGASEEEIARTLVDLRNEAKDITRAGMSPEAIEVLEQRNIAKYGNPLGPTADQQFAKYGSWAKVIEAATRTSAAVDQELGLEPRH